MTKRIIFLCIVFVFIAVGSFADTIILKSGKEIQGEILERNEDSVKINFYGVDLTYYLAEIDKINGEDVVVPVKEVKSVAREDIESEVSSQEQLQPIELSQPKDVQLTEESKTKQIKEEPISLESQKESKLSVEPEKYNFQDEPIQARPATAAMAIGLVGVLFIVSLVFYIYCALCLYFIAKKTNQGPVWLAWVPIANLFLMCKIATLKYWWLLIFLASFIPVIGALANAGFLAFIWYKIALARNKPGWIGILIFIPLVNLGVMGYLAFSD